MRVSGPGLTVAHDKVKSYSWQPVDVGRQPIHPTKYRLPMRTKDPFRHLLRDYASMEAEKDARQFGALEDVSIRTRGAGRARERWIEVLKPLLSIVAFGEYAAMKSMAMLIDAVDNPELRQGYIAQMLDELRHTNHEAYLIRYLAKSAVDPAGFNSAFRTRALDPICRAGQACFETFINDDPLVCALNLQVVAETAYTNSIFVAPTEIAAANDDVATSSVFLSVQSDEARHMANGYATLAAILAEPENLQMLQDDFDAAFWRQHVFLDNFLGAVYDYFPEVRLDSYREYWKRWVWDDWMGGYIERLEPFGLVAPRWAERARAEVAWGGHTTAMLSAALWPIHPWRSDAMVGSDMDYLETRYPGWHSYFGGFWEDYRAMADPKQGVLALGQIAQPSFCRVCQMPAALPRPDMADVRFRRDAAGRRHAFCSWPCEMAFRAAPHRYRSLTWGEEFHGTGLAEYITRAGLLRADGRTLVGQPHLHHDDRWLWTIDDIRRAEIEIRDPLIDMPTDAFRPLGGGA